jgi:hypothetical protein
MRESLSFPLALLKLNRRFQLESPPSQDGLLLQGRVLLSSEFYQVYLLFL